MVRDLELIISSSLCSILEEYAVGEEVIDAQAGPWGNLMDSLQSFIPWILGEKHEDWNEDGETLANIRIGKVIKAGVSDALITGICTLASDQTLVPFYCRIKIDSSGDRFEEIQCKLGAADEGGLKRCQSESSGWLDPTNIVDETKVTWAYKVTLEKGQVPRTYIPPEERMALSFRSFLEEHPVGELFYEISPSPKFLSLLERHLQSLLREKYEEFSEALDGFTIYKGARTGDMEVELMGMSFLLPSDCVPFFLRLRMDRSGDRVEVGEFRMCEKSEKGSTRKDQDPWTIFFSPDAPEPDWAYEIICEKGKIK